MDLKRRIIEERISSLEQLEPPERELAQADSELLALISENRWLSPAEPAFGPVPEREAMLAAARQRAENNKEHSMTTTLISRLFYGRSLLAQASLGLALLAVVLVGSVLLFPKGQPLAAVNGYVLVFDFGQVSNSGDIEADHAALQGRLDVLETAVHDWTATEEAARAEAGEPVEHSSIKLMIQAKVDNGNAQAVVGFVDGTQEMLESLQAALAEVPELPVPQVTDSTWFLDESGQPCADGAVVIGILDHRFEFPAGTDSKTAEDQINAWLAENKPELKAQVEIISTGDRTEVKVRLTDKEEE